MPGFLSALQSLFFPARRAAPVPLREPESEPGKCLRLADLDPAAIASTRQSLDEEARQIFHDIEENRIDQRSLITAYDAARGDEGRQRTLARQYAYAKDQGGKLEERHNKLTLRLRLWDSVDMLGRQQAWQEKVASSSRHPGLDTASLKAMIEQAVAESEHDSHLLREMLDTLDDAASRDEAQRNIGLRDVMAEMAALAAQQREHSAAKEQVQLTGLADGLESWLAQSQAAASKVSLREGEAK